MLIESAPFESQKLEARPKINKFRAPRLTTKNWRFKDRMNEKVKSRITLTFFFLLFASFFLHILKKKGFLLHQFPYIAL